LPYLEEKIMAKTTIRQILQINQALLEVSKTPMPAAISFKLALLQDKTSGYVKKFFESRDDLFTTLGEHDSVSGQKVIKEENKKKYFEEVENLLDVDVEMEIPHLSLATLNSVNLPPTFFQTFKDFIVE